MSRTLEHILKHWDKVRLQFEPDPTTHDVPFNIELFCTENDAELTLWKERAEQRGHSLVKLTEDRDRYRAALELIDMHPACDEYPELNKAVEDALKEGG